MIDNAPRTCPKTSATRYADLWQAPEGRCSRYGIFMSRRNRATDVPWPCRMKYLVQIEDFVDGLVRERSGITQCVALHDSVFSTVRSGNVLVTTLRQDLRSTHSICQRAAAEAVTEASSICKNN